MKKLIMILLFLVLAAVTPAYAQKSNWGDANSGKIYRLERNEVVNEDLFAAAETVEIDGTVNGDLYIAGANILISGNITGDLLVAGGTVNFYGNVQEDARIGAGNMVISGKVGKNASLFGGNITISDNAAIEGGLSTLFGNLTQSSSIGRYIKGAGGNVTLSDRVGGNVDLAVGSLNISPGADIAGNLTYWSRDNGNIDSGAQIAGETVYYQVEKMDKFDTGRVKKTAATSAKFGSLIISFILGLLYIYLFRGSLLKTSDTLRERPLFALLAGLVSPFVLLALIIVLVLTVLGIPLAVFVFFLYLFIVYIARIPVFFAAGLYLQKRFGSEERPVWGFTVGLLVYFILSMVPYINVLLKFLVYTLGTGAFFISFFVKKPASLPAKKARSGK